MEEGATEGRWLGEAEREAEWGEKLESGTGERLVW